MGLLGRLFSRGEPEVHVGDPRFDDWEPVADFEDVKTGSAFVRHLREAGIDAVLTADWAPDEFGRGDLQIQVPPGSWSEAEEILSGLDLD
ncbi:MAG: hypothetical protein ACO3ZZ_08455 [Solirubrobacterales bacterium]